MNDHLIPILSGILGGILGMILICWWYINSGRLGLYLDDIFARARARAQAKYVEKFPESVHKTIGVYDHIPDQLLQEACNDMHAKYKEIELSTITHNIGETNEYTCVLLVGRQKRQT